jgi:hypothetical protein
MLMTSLSFGELIFNVFISKLYWKFAILCH